MAPMLSLRARAVGLAAVPSARKKEYAPPAANPKLDVVKAVELTPIRSSWDAVGAAIPVVVFWLTTNALCGLVSVPKPILPPLKIVSTPFNETPPVAQSALLPMVQPPAANDVDAVKTVNLPVLGVVAPIAEPLMPPLPHVPLSAPVSVPTSNTLPFWSIVNLVTPPTRPINTLPEAIAPVSARIAEMTPDGRAC